MKCGVRRTESNTKLSNHAHISPCLRRLHKLLCTRPCNCPQIVHQICFGHANTAIDEGESFVDLIGHQQDEELLLGIKLALVSQALEADLVQGIGGIADQLSKENLLVAVESTDDQTQKLVDFSRKSKKSK